MASTQVQLTPEMEEFLDRLVKTGAYLNRADAIRGILRELMKASETTAAGGDTGGTVTIQLSTVRNPRKGGHE